MQLDAPATGTGDHVEAAQCLGRLSDSQTHRVIDPRSPENHLSHCAGRLSRLSLAAASNVGFLAAVGFVCTVLSFDQKAR